MSHEILSVKLYELDKKIGQLHSLAHFSETADHEEMREEIRLLKREYEQGRRELYDRLSLSRSAVIKKLSCTYRKIEESVDEAKKEVGLPAVGAWDGSTDTEEKLLLAEYALDFAVQEATYALLISMDAIDSQKEQIQKEENFA